MKRVPAVETLKPGTAVCYGEYWRAAFRHRAFGRYTHNMPCNTASVSHQGRPSPIATRASLWTFRVKLSNARIEAA